MNKYFFFKDVDAHYIIHFFGIKFNIPHKVNLKHTQVNENGLNTEERSPRLIVSLTTFPARINSVHKTISTLLTQSLKPDKVVLWLAKSQFPNLEKDLPLELLELQKYGLEIGWCDEDIKSYKKLLPALIKYPEDIIVTTDDDIYYDKDLLKSLYTKYLANPKNIYAKRTVRLKLDNDKVGCISSRKYLYKTLEEPTFFNQLVGCGGCLYPPNSLYKDILNLDMIKKTVPTHDDVYFWSMAVLNNTKIQLVDGYDVSIYLVEGSQNVGLKFINKTGSSGISLEDAYEKMIEEYPSILENLKSEVSKSVK